MCGDGFPIELPGVNDRHLMIKNGAGVFINRDWVPSADYVDINNITGAKSVISLSAQIITVFKTYDRSTTEDIS